MTDMKSIAALLSTADAAARSGRVGRARQCYQQILAISSANVLALQRLALLEETHGKLADAIALLRRLLAIRPNDATVLVHLGVCLKKAGALDEALAMLRRAVTVDPAYSPGFSNLMLLLEETGGTPEAVLAMKKSAEHAREFHLAALSGATPPAVCPPDFLVALFDGYAERFDDHLVNKLAYRGPDLLAEIVSDRGNAGLWDVMDLGCGTGMSAIPFRDRARSMIGVDLSPGMLQQAARRTIAGKPAYDALQQMDVVTALGQHTSAFDLILAAEVFVYIGDLHAVFLATTKALRPGGLMAFTTESFDGSGDYQLAPWRRYGHCPQYIQRLADEAKLEWVEHRREFLRKGDSGSDVNGDVYLLRKPVSSQLQRTQAGLIGTPQCGSAKIKKEFEPQRR
jgi:predicted TPR repeat methyltransferase